MGSQLRVPRPPPLPRSEPSRSLPPPVAVLPQCRREPAAALRTFLNSFGSSPSRQRPPWSTFNSSEPLSEFLDQWQELGRPLRSARARHPHPGKIDSVGSGAECSVGEHGSGRSDRDPRASRGRDRRSLVRVASLAPGVPALRLGGPARPPRLAPLPTVSQAVCRPDPAPVPLIPGGSSLPIGRSGRSIGRPSSCWARAGRCSSS
jgi:hypothetical protein